MVNDVELYSRIIFEDDVKHNQIRLTINEFHGVEYLHLRKYYLDFDEEWKPSSEGISMPIDFDNCRELFEGLAEIISLAESKEILEREFGELINKLYK
jgi:hypothetical protein